MVKHNTSVFNNREISNNSQSESMCNGLVRRLFKEVINKDKRYLAKKIGNAFNVFNQTTMSFQFTKISKSKIVNITTAMFADFFWTSNCVFKSKDHIRLLGVTIVNDNLHLIRVLYNSKKPHKTVIGMFKIGLTIHVVSRIIYRFKPKDLIVTLYEISSIFNTMLEELKINQKDGNEFTLICPNLGAIVLGFNYIETEKQISAITFIDYEKLNTKQIEKGRWQLRYIKDNNLSDYNFIMKKLSSLISQENSETMVINGLVIL